MNNIYKAIGSLIVLIGIAFTINAHFAKATEFALLQEDVKCQNINNQAWRIQERIWTLQDRYGDDISEGNKSNKEELNSLQLKLNILLKQLDKCNKGIE